MLAQTAYVRSHPLKKYNKLQVHRVTENLQRPWLYVDSSFLVWCRRVRCLASFWVITAFNPAWLYQLPCPHAAAESMSSIMPACSCEKHVSYYARKQLRRTCMYFLSYVASTSKNYYKLNDFFNRTTTKKFLSENYCSIPQLVAQ